MLKYKVKIKINGTVLYKGVALNQNQIFDEYEVGLVRLVEQKLIKVIKVNIEEPKEFKKKEKKYSETKTVSELD